MADPAAEESKELGFIPGDAECRVLCAQREGEEAWRRIIAYVMLAIVFAVVTELIWMAFELHNK